MFEELTAEEMAAISKAISDCKIFEDEGYHL